jgi:hypothetical protein
MECSAWKGFVINVGVSAPVKHFVVRGKKEVCVGKTELPSHGGIESGKNELI